MYFDRVKYQIQHKNKLYDIKEPVTWDDENILFGRSKNNLGNFSNVSDEFQFTLETAKLITKIRHEDGINADVFLIKHSRDGKTDRWYNEYIVGLDIGQYQKKGNMVTVRVNSTGLFSRFKAHKLKEIEIERDTDLYGNKIGDLPTKRLRLNGRKILEVNQWDNANEEQFVFIKDNVRQSYLVGNLKKPICTIAMLLKSVSSKNDNAFNVLEQSTDVSINSVYNNKDIKHYGKTNTLSASQIFFKNNNLKNDVVVDLSIDQILEFEEKNSRRVDIYVNLLKFDFNESKGVYTDSHILKEYGAFTNDASAVRKIYVNIDEEFSTTLEPNQSLGLFYEFVYRDEDDETMVGLGFKSETKALSVSVSIPTYSPPNTINVVMVYDLLDRMSKMIKGNIKSSYFGRKQDGYDKNGKGSMTAIAHGFWIRNFSKSDKLYKPITISFANLLNSLMVQECVGMAVERDGTRECIRVEHLDFFYQKFTSIHLGEVADVVEYVNLDKVYSNIVIGYKKPSGDLYGESMGLDEPNTQVRLSTPIDRLVNSESTKTMLSEIRRDSYGVEYARRKRKDEYPTEDTKYDKEIFAFDVKENNDGSIDLKKWHDDLDSAPKNIFSPDTAFNIMYSPMRLLEKHAAYLKIGMQKNADDFFRYISSEGNSRMITQPKNGKVIKENEDIKISHLRNARYGDRVFEFSALVTDDIRRQLRGKTKNIPNVYGLVEFKIRGKTYKGHLLEVEGSKFKVEG